MGDEIERFYFPYETIRDVQKELMNRIERVLDKKKDMLIHAPTGLGKTVAVLCPALTNSLKKDKTIFFLTSRHTQHFIAIETLRLIREKYGVSLTATDIVGKKWMCPVDGVERLYSGEFADYCKSVREKGTCEFYVKTRNGQKLSPEASLILAQLKGMPPSHSGQIIALCKENRLCPYELITELARISRVVIADYYYVFNPVIRDLFFKKADKHLENSIIIVDEGHNLPSRLRNLLTEKLSTPMLDNAIKEAKKFGYDDTLSNLKLVRSVLERLAAGIRDDGELLIEKDAFKKGIMKGANYDELVADFTFIGNSVRETEKVSFIGSIAKFLEAWDGEDRGFVRIISKKATKKEIITLSYRCLDPSLVSKDVINQASSTIMMSGTLNPIEMYRDILGFSDVEVAECPSPFPRENQLNLVIAQTTTKFSERNEKQYRAIAEICSNIVNLIPGNTILFFPSYELRDTINRFFEPLCNKTTFIELPNMSKEEKARILDKFKAYNETGAVLLAIVSGSFGEGIDLPGDYLKAAVVVGLPLQLPDLETKAMIRYYDELFSKGWDYGYVFPAMNKVMQNAGRVIRSETDRGAIIFLDVRYSWHQYNRCFPKEWELVTTSDYLDRLSDFFGCNLEEKTPKPKQ